MNFYGMAQDIGLSSKGRASIAYSGETVFHYGITLAYQRYFVGNSPRRSKLFYGVNLTGYRHPENHIGLLSLPELGYTYSSPSGFQASLSTQVGYMRRFYDGETFTVNNQGQIRKVPLAGNHALTYGVSTSVGFNFGRAANRRTGFFIQPRFLWEYPYNTKALVHPFVDIGISRLLWHENVRQLFSLFNGAAIRIVRENRYLWVPE